MRNSYNIGNIWFAGLACNERFSEGNLGRIVIGGDRGDVEAPSAENHIAELAGDSGVMLWDVTLLTTLDLRDDEVEDEVREVVRQCYDSIQEETFTQSGKE